MAAQAEPTKPSVEPPTTNGHRGVALLHGPSTGNGLQVQAYLSFDNTHYCGLNAMKPLALWRRQSTSPEQRPAFGPTSCFVSAGNSWQAGTPNTYVRERADEAAIAMCRQNKSKRQIHTRHAENKTRRDLKCHSV